MNNPHQPIENGRAVRQAQSDDDDARVYGVQMPDSVEKIAVCCQEDCTSQLGFREDRLIAGAFSASSTQIEHPMPHSFEDSRGRFRKVFIEEKRHATAS